MSSALDSAFDEFVDAARLVGGETTDSVASAGLTRMRRALEVIGAELFAQAVAGGDHELAESHLRLVVMERRVLTFLEEALRSRCDRLAGSQIDLTHPRVQP